MSIAMRPPKGDMGNGPEASAKRSSIELKDKIERL